MWQQRADQRTGCKRRQHYHRGIVLRLLLRPAAGLSGSFTSAVGGFARGNGCFMRLLAGNVCGDSCALARLV